MKARLCVREFANTENLPAICVAVEGFGYDSIWLGEHHSPVKVSNPMIGAGIALASTTHLRVIIAGLLVRYHHPLRLALDSQMLRRVFGQRLDIGFARARSGNEQFHSMELFDDGDTAMADAIRLCRQIGWQGAGSPMSKSAGLWLCGDSDESAELAGVLGLGYATRLADCWLGQEKAIEEVAQRLATHRDLLRKNFGDADSYCSAIWVQKAHQDDVASSTHGPNPPCVGRMLDYGYDETTVVADAEKLALLSQTTSLSHIVIGPNSAAPLASTLNYLKNLSSAYLHACTQL